MASASRRLILGIEGDLANQGRVPISLLAKKLVAFQSMVFGVGSALFGGSKGGAFKAEVLSACSLVFVETRRSSLEVVTELPPPSEPHLPHVDLGARTHGSVTDTLDALEQHDTEKLFDLFPVHGPRRRILKSGVLLAPEEDQEYGIRVGPPEHTVPLLSDVRSYLTDLVLSDTPEEPGTFRRTVTGMLYLIDVAEGERRVGVQIDDHKIPCDYSEGYEDLIRNLVPGSFVEVEGSAHLNDHGDVSRIVDLADVRSVELSPLYWSRVRYDDRTLLLREPIQVAIDYRDGLWVYEYAPLGITSCAETRAEALKGFRMEFTACWDTIAQEDDGNLTLDARELKQKLLDLVDREEGLF